MNETTKRINDKINTIQIQAGVVEAPVAACPNVSKRTNDTINPIMLRSNNQNQILVNGFIAIFGRVDIFRCEYYIYITDTYVVTKG